VKFSFTIVSVSLLAILTIGCGTPVSYFTSSEDTKSLDKKAREAVEQSLLEHFGTPTELVAWTELPIDFGRIDGKVVAAPAEKSNRFQVELTSDSEDVSRLTVNDLRGLALVWESGKYRTAMSLNDKNEEIAVNFQVTGYDADEKTLDVNVTLEPPPELGDRFYLLGYQLAQGHKLYRKYCVHCHGVNGDGKGPTAEYLNPRPRDYRRGIIKFDSTGRQDPPTRDDLNSTIKKGIPGTYMPSFLLEDHERDKIIEYVRFLAMRGEFERLLFSGMKNDFTKIVIDDRVNKGEDRNEIQQELDQYLAEDFPDRVKRSLERIGNAWKLVENSAHVVNPKSPRILPDVDPDSIRRGRALFLSGKTKCVSCHGVGAKGDGPNLYAYQDKPDGSGKYKVPGVFDDWGNKIQPRDLTRGIYRGGRRPLDLYRRIHTGIKGTPMTAFGTALSEKEIWDLVNYVMSIPFQ